MATGGYASAGRRQMQWRSSCGDSRPRLSSRAKFDSLLPVRHPDIFYLGGMFKEPAPLGHLRIEPVDRSALVGPNLLQVPNRHRLRSRDSSLVSRTPDGINGVVLGQRLQELRRVASHNVHRAARHVTGVEKLVKIA